MRIIAAAAACAALTSTAASFAGATPATPNARTAVHYACSAANSADVPCRFSTPTGNIRCLWTPSPNQVTCELLSNHRAYRLRPTGKAKTVHVTISARGETLPTNQLLTFPESLGCNATRTTMFCGQAYGLGEFKLSPKGSHAAGRRAR